MIKLKPVGNSRPGPPPAPIGSRPSIWKAMAENTIHYEEEPIGFDIPDKPVKKGKPTKEDKKRERASKASEAVRALVASKPTIKEIREWVNARITELNKDD